MAWALNAKKPSQIRKASNGLSPAAETRQDFPVLHTGGLKTCSAGPEIWVIPGHFRPKADLERGLKMPQL